METSKFKNKPFEHQLQCLNKHGRDEYFALLADMGTGKSFIIINNIADLWSSGDLDAALILAPNGVHYNWLLQEIPKHMPDWVRYEAAAWSADMNKTEKAALEALTTQADSSVLRIMLMNWEAIATDRAFKAAKKFAMASRRLMIAADESHNIKNPSAARTKALMKLKPMSHWRRIITGTPITNSPFDAFGQFSFLDENILQTSSYFAFKAEYAEMLPAGHRLLDHIVKKNSAMKPYEREALASDINALKSQIVHNGREELIEALSCVLSAYEACDLEGIIGANEQLRNLFAPGLSAAKLSALRTMSSIDARTARAMRTKASAANPKRLPQIIARDKENRPRYRNMEKLSALIAPCSFRVMKKDCLDLPEKIYKTAYFEMTPQQKAIYKKAKDESRLVFRDQEIPFNKLVIMGKLAQITSGYFLHPDAEEPVRIEGGNPKMDLLKERVLSFKEQGKRVIVWARYRVQIADIAAALRTEKLDVVEYHGGVNRADRLAAIESFTNGSADVFVGNQQAGGVGITLVSSHCVVYFSNDFSFGNRIQSEDRAHRIGQTEDVIYTDLIARNSIDEIVIRSLQDKQEISSLILAFEKSLEDNDFAIPPPT